MKHTQKAFTLIELLVVIAIIAILAAILFPVFAQAKTAAKKVRAISQFKQVGTATMIYMSDYDDMIPPKFRMGFGPEQGGGDPFQVMTFDDFIDPYLKNRQMIMSTEDAFRKTNVPGIGMYKRSFAPASNMFRGVQISAAWGWGWSDGEPSISSTAVPEVSRSIMYGEKRQILAPTWTRQSREWFEFGTIFNTRRQDLPSSDPRAAFGEIFPSYAGGAVFVMGDTSTKVLRANGFSQAGPMSYPHGWRFEGYVEKAAQWVTGSGDPMWDRGIACLDWPWSASDTGRSCTLPGE